MRTKHLMKVAAPVAVISLLASACAGASGEDSESAEGPGSGVEVTMARANWSTGFFQAAVFGQLLAELGHEVSDAADAELGPDIFHPALAQGGYDLWANGWIPNHLPSFEAETPTGETVGDLVSEVGHEVKSGALQGYLIDKKTTEEYRIESLAQIVEDPELSRLFDTDGDGVADLQGCNEGWGCTKIIVDTIETNGWQDKLTQVQGEYSVLFTDLLARAGRGEPVLCYT